MKKIFFISLLSLCYGLCIAQKNKATCYFVSEKDTVFCNDLSYTTSVQGELRKLEYKDLQGKKISLKGKENIPNVLTIFIDGAVIDKTPLNAVKPNGSTRYTPRILDGKLIINQTDVGENNSPSDYIYSVKMPDGTYYKLNDKNMINSIKPFLEKCEKFKNEYKGNYLDSEGGNYIF